MLSFLLILALIMANIVYIAVLKVYFRHRQEQHEKICFDTAKAVIKGFHSTVVNKIPIQKYSLLDVEYQYQGQLYSEVLNIDFESRCGDMFQKGKQLSVKVNPYNPKQLMLTNSTAESNKCLFYTAAGCFLNGLMIAGLLYDLFS